MGWDIDNEGNSNRGEPLPVGLHDVEIIKAVKAKDTKAGDRQVLVVFNDSEGREAAYFAPIEGPARFKAAQLMKGLGYTSAMMDEARFQPDHLIIESVAKQWLIGNHCRIEVTKKPNLDFLDVRVLPAATPRASQSSRAPSKAPPLPADADVPF
jgi:hypothetical protein